MAVTYSSNIVIKSSYKEGKTPAEYMGIELTFGKNAFSSLKDAVNTEYCSADTPVILLDSKTTIDFAVPGFSVSAVNPADVLPAPAKNTLNITGQEFSGDIYHFKTLNITDSAIQNATVTNESFKGDNFKSTSVGKVTVNNSTAESLYGYATIVITGKDSYVSTIYGGAGYADGPKGMTTTTAGSVTVTDGTVAEIMDYKTVTLKNAEVNYAASSVNSTMKNNKATVKRNGVLKATDSIISGDVNNFNTVTLTNSSAAGFYNYIDADKIEYGDAEEKKQYNASGSFKAVIDKKAEMLEYSIEGEIVNYNSVTVSGYTDKKGFIKTFDINGNIRGGKLDAVYVYAEGEEKVISSTSVGTVKISYADIEGGIYNYKTVTLTNSDIEGDFITGGKSSDDFYEDITVDGSFTFKLDKTSEYKTYECLADVKYFKTVNVTGYDDRAIKTGSFIGGDVKNGEKIANGTATFKEDVWVSGIDGISGFKTVNLTDTFVEYNIDSFGTKGTVVNMTDSFVYEEITGVQKLNIKKEFNCIGAYTGTDLDDTLTINKNTVLMVGKSIDFADGTKDKLAINGTLLLSEDFESITNFNSISGSGEIAASGNIISDLGLADANIGKVKLLNLGATSQNFVSSKYETGDNTAKKAYECDFDGSNDVFTGWLSNNDDGSGLFNDVVDFIKMDDSCKIAIYDAATDEIATGITVLVNGIIQSEVTFANMAVREDAVIEIRRNEGQGSLAYYIEQI